MLMSSFNSLRELELFLPAVVLLWGAVCMFLFQFPTGIRVISTKMEKVVSEGVGSSFNSLRELELFLHSKGD